MRIGRATLFTDSLSVLQALRGMRRPTRLLLETWKVLREVNVDLIWTRAHVGTRGNERADELAKETATGGDDDIPLSYAFASEKTVKNAIADEGYREWQERWESATNERWTKNFIGDAKEFRKMGDDLVAPGNTTGDRARQLRGLSPADWAKVQRGLRLRSGGHGRTRAVRLCAYGDMEGAHGDGGDQSGTTMATQRGGGQRQRDQGVVKWRSGHSSAERLKSSTGCGVTSSRISIYLGMRVE
ncbi:hypothetical protein Trydic_g15233 [Trypoxylus dichotomus]